MNFQSTTLLLVLLASFAMVLPVVHGQQQQQLGRRRRSLALFQLDDADETLLKQKDDNPFTVAAGEMEAQASSLSYHLESCELAHP